MKPAPESKGGGTEARAAAPHYTESMDRADAVVVGSGPNGLAAAVALARAGWRVLVREARRELGGGARTAALTLPGFLHDPCSAVHPLGAGSPFFRTLPLAEHGLAWLEPPISVGHPFDDGTAALVVRSPAETAGSLDRADARAWPALLAPLADRFHDLAADVLAGPARLPRHPLLLARFGLLALQPAAGLARRRLAGPRARALLAGMAAHAARPLDAAGSAAFGLVLAASAHAVGWPIAAGGSGRIAGALAAELHRHGGAVETGAEVRSLAELDHLRPRAVLLDLTPRQVLRVAGARLPARYARRLGRFRYGPGAFKLDYALSAPIPWRAPGLAGAGTVHLGGTLEELAAAEAAVARGEPAARPFVLVGQPTPLDPSRAPAGRHVAWAYAHVPHGWRGDATAAIEAQLERFAPGFREVVLARHARGTAALEAENANLVGGDVGAGANDLAQTLLRPVASAVPWRTPARGLWLCSASTPPGGGVHGMCGWNAARAVLRAHR